MIVGLLGLNDITLHYMIVLALVLHMKPLAPSDARPDMAQLKIVAESDIRKFQVIGSGAFGTVYKVTLVCA